MKKLLLKHLLFEYCLQLNEAIAMAQDQLKSQLEPERIRVWKNRVGYEFDEPSENSPPDMWEWEEVGYPTHPALVPIKEVSDRINDFRNSLYE